MFDFFQFWFFFIFWLSFFYLVFVHFCCCSCFFCLYGLSSIFLSLSLFLSLLYISTPSYTLSFIYITQITQTSSCLYVIVSSLIFSSDLINLNHYFTALFLNFIIFAICTVFLTFNNYYLPLSQQIQFNSYELCGHFDPHLKILRNVDRFIVYIIVYAFHAVILALWHHLFQLTNDVFIQQALG